MPTQLAKQQIAQKLSDGRNYKRLYHELKIKYDSVVLENKQLRSMLAEQKAYFESLIETQNARIAELETMVFGRKPKDRADRSGGDTKPPKPPKVSRGSDSYRRPVPPDESITGETHHSISACKHCDGELVEKREYTRYIEDIVLAALASAPNQLKTIEKQIIEKGYCIPCGKYSSAADLRGQDVSLGPNVRSLVCYLITLRDHSYDQVVHLLWDLYGLHITDGEIANILETRRLQLLPEYERLKDSIRAGPVHLDESKWRIQSEANAGYAWSMSSVATSDVVFKLADNRGKGNAEELVGEAYQGVGITDRYGAYKHLFLLHQICWAHLQRNARDLTRLEFLSPEKLVHVTKFYKALAAIYAAIRRYQDEAFDQEARDAQASQLAAQVAQLAIPSELDPKKLQTLKAGILEYQDSLFVCLTTDGIPADNNRAERDIRKLVMKRKKSFGCKTTKGARVLEVLLSVAWSTYNRDRDGFFQEFGKLGLRPNPNL
jgi:transposase